MGKAWFVIACVLQLVAGFYYMVSGLVAPVWAVLILWVIWLGLTMKLYRMRGEGPKTLLIPVVAVAIWYIVLWAGDAFLGWTA